MLASKHTYLGGSISNDLFSCATMPLPDLTLPTAPPSALGTTQASLLAFLKELSPQQGEIITTSFMTVATAKTTVGCFFAFGSRPYASNVGNHSEFQRYYGEQSKPAQ